MEGILISFSILFLTIGIFYLVMSKKILLKIIISLTSIFFFFLFGITGIGIMGYKNLLKEEVIAQVRAESIENFVILYVNFPGEEKENIYVRRETQEKKWGISANFLKWKKWLSFLGFGISHL